MLARDQHTTLSKWCQDNFAISWRESPCFATCKREAETEYHHVLRNSLQLIDEKAHPACHPSGGHCAACWPLGFLPETASARLYTCRQCPAQQASHRAQSCATQRERRLRAWLSWRAGATPPTRQPSGLPTPDPFLCSATACATPGTQEDMERNVQWKWLAVVLIE